MKRFYSLAWWVFLGIALYYVSLFCEKKTDGFTIAKIHSPLGLSPEWDISPISPAEQENVRSTLKQKFHYLASGGQSYAFLSDDGTTVIKFFKCHRLMKNKEKLNRDFTSYKLAFEKLKEETGLIFVHLNKTENLLPEVTIVDKLHIEHKLKLDSIHFVLQKRAELVHPYITALMRKDDKEGACKALRAIVQVILKRCGEGIFDEDAKIHRNFGFVGEEAIVIDAGRFRYDPSRRLSDVQTNDLATSMRRFSLWLEENYPSLTPILQEEIHKALCE